MLFPTPRMERGVTAISRHKCGWREVFFPFFSVLFSFFTFLRHRHVLQLCYILVRVLVLGLTKMSPSRFKSKVLLPFYKWTVLFLNTESILGSTAPLRLYLFSSFCESPFCFLNCAVSKYKLSRTASNYTPRVTSPTEVTFRSTI